MRTFELEIGLLVVIKLPGLPVCGVVAAATLFAESFFMDVIALMAGVTVVLGFLKDAGDMAFFTRQRCM